MSLWEAMDAFCRARFGIPSLRIESASLSLSALIVGVELTGLRPRMRIHSGEVSVVDQSAVSGKILQPNAVLSLVGLAAQAHHHH